MAAITTEHVISVIATIWHLKPATASQVRGRIERVFSYAKTMGWRNGENPAAWRDPVKNLLPSRYVVAKIEHFEAVPSGRDPPIHAGLARRSYGRRKSFGLLCTDRRMKGKRQHIVPLSPRALAILKEMRLQGSGRYVFPSHHENAPLSNGTFRGVLDRLDYSKKTTPHGLRSTFRDWAGDKTDFHREVIEFALAHNIKDETEAAYRRSTAIEKRRELMNQWARYCQQKPRSAEIIPMPPRKKRGQLRATG